MILRRIAAAHAGHSCTLVAIEGPAGAGKSTLAAALQKVEPRISVVHLDDFYRPMESAAMAQRHSPENYEAALDWRRLRELVLRPLRQGREVQYPRYDRQRRQPTAMARIAPRGIVLVEGVYAARPEISPFYRATIFVTAPREERARRIAARRNPDRTWVERWTAAEDWYLEQFDPGTFADLTVVAA